MNRSFVIPAAILLIAGAVAIAIFKSSDPEESGSTGKTDPATPAASPRTGPNPGSSGDRTPRTSAERGERQSRQSELVDKYGGARTAKAREVSTNVVSILEDVVAVGEMMMEGGQQFGGRGRMVSGLTRRMGIELSDEQQEKALALYDEWQKAELEKSKDAVKTLRDDPTAMMELFLAGDAMERGEMSEEEYAAVCDEAAGELIGVINPLDRENFRGGRMAGDDQLMDRFSGLLDPEQQEKFSEYRQKQTTDAGDGPTGNGNITGMSAMPLDTLDEAITGASKMTSGFRSVMEGMGSLREIRPQDEQNGDGN